MRITTAKIILIAALFSACKQKTLFEQVDPSYSNIRFSNRLEKRKDLSIINFLYYYNGGGVAIGDINNDGLPDIFFTANHKGGNKLYLNKGNFQFEDITSKAGVAGGSDWSSGVTMADVNGDGLLDIYVCAVSGCNGLKGHNELYINNGNNTFTESSKKYGLDLAAFSSQAVFFDYDHDGDLDCFVLNQSHFPVGTVKDTSQRKVFDSLSGGRLYRNDLSTMGKFTDVSAQAGIIESNSSYGLGISVADLNNDGWDDIYIGNDFNENDYCYINNGNGSFTESGSKHFGHYSFYSMGNDIADFNNDGQPDIVSVDMLPPDEATLKSYGSGETPDVYKLQIEKRGFQNQYSRNCLQKNNGNGKSFSDVALMDGVSATDWSWCPLFADFDNDGKKDLFISSGIPKRQNDLDYIQFLYQMSTRGSNSADVSGMFDDVRLGRMPDGASHPFLFKGNDDAGFIDKSNDWGTGTMKGSFNGAAYADLDGDGNLDLVINCIDTTAVILKNNSTPKNHLDISFSGVGMNKFGIGSKAYLFSHNAKNEKLVQLQELMPTRGFQSASDCKLHFGLDSLTADSLMVVWPDQKYQVIQKPIINKILICNQSNAVGKFIYENIFPAKPVELQNITAQIKCNWRHIENQYNDFNFQYLIPHEESTRGPKIAVGDINNDGLSDFYVCGARGQAGALMLQNPDGSFESIDTALFSKFTFCENVDAVFFDANGDGFQDLLVINGGNESTLLNSPSSLQDHLFINDGHGHFTDKPDFMPSELYNKSCVAIADVDHDGDMDIFIGSLSNAGGSSFGYPMKSFLLLNNGHGNFSLASTNTISLAQIGTVTSAQFADINNDGWPDLVVAGEWMPVKVFINNHGKFTEQDIANSTGLWQTVFPKDVNGDGNIDLLIGNWGHNSKLWAGKNGPLKMYVNDFDKNGIIEQIMCYTIDGKEYTFLGKDELERQLPMLKKNYLTYGEMAGKDVQFLFKDLLQKCIELKAETLSSSCFLNDGKGNFTRYDLPDAIQQAPVFAFSDMQNKLLAVGNFYGVIPYEGRYDALFPTEFSFSKQQNSFSDQTTIFSDSIAEYRDAKWIKIAQGKKLLVLAQNNGGLQFFREN